MNNYDFRCTKKTTRLELEELPISAMNYNGMWFEEYIPNYETLVVEGREMISTELESDNVNTGLVIASQRLPQRELTIKYKISAKTSEELLYSYRLLMEQLLKFKDVPIFFNDERDVYYYGRYVSSEVVTGEQLSVVSSFTVVCQDPRKYTFKTFETTGVVETRLPFTQAPDKIEVQIYGKYGLKITNGQQELKLSGVTFNEKDLVIFDFNQGVVLINGKNQTNLLDLDSDFENFTLKQGQKILCNNGPIKIYYKEVII